jgi:hypothetical protein
LREAGFVKLGVVAATVKYHCLSSQHGGNEKGVFSSKKNFKKNMMEEHGFNSLFHLREPGPGFDDLFLMVDGIPEFFRMFPESPVSRKVIFARDT